MARGPSRPTIDPDISRLAAAANDTIFLDRTGRRFVTVTAVVGNDTLDLRAVGNDTLFGGGAGRTLDTIPPKFRGETISPLRGGNDTLFRAPAQGPFQTVDRASTGSGAQILTANVIDATTRRPVSVTYNRQTGQYFDKESQSWIPAPGWMRQQVR